MSIKDCLNNAQADGEISRDEADALTEIYDGLVRHYGSATKAKAELVSRLMRQAEHQKRQALIADEARTRAEGFVTGFRDARGQPDPAKAIVALIEHNGQVAMPAGMSSVLGRSKAILGLAQAELEALLHEFRRTWVTGATRNTARLENLVREAAGEGTGDDAAKGFAKAWLETAEKLRQRFNAAGGAIGALDGWFLPQIHNRLALIRAGKDRWLDYITPRLDGDRMRNPLTGTHMTPDDLKKSLSWIYDNITSDGWQNREPTAQRLGLGAISNQRADHRFLMFKNVDGWLEYQAEFGGGADPFAAMMDHLRGMSEDIAAMEVLGPNPRATLTYLESFVRRQAELKQGRQPAPYFPDRSEYLGRAFSPEGSWFATKSPIDYANGMIKTAEDMWDIFRGNTGVVNQRVADAFGTLRNLNVASKLGGAALSAVTDLGFQHMARLFSGLPQISIYNDMLKAFAHNKRDAVAAGMILDTAVHVLHEEARWAGGMHGPEWTRYMADRVIATTGLQAWTQAGIHGFSLGFMSQLASDADKGFAELPSAMQRTFARYGLSGKDWDAMRVGADPLFLKPADVYRAMDVAGRGDERIAERYLEMILQETEYAVPVGTLQSKARSGGNRQRGVLVDEIYRSGLQFKMFGMSVALLQGQRIATEIVQRGLWRGAGYAAGLFITTTLYGMLALQLKDLAKGKDARPIPTDPRNPEFYKLWGAAVLQGGGAGIYGDFLASETNRMGGGLARTIAGPSADVAASVLSLTSGNLAQYFSGGKTNAGREAVRLLGGNTPFGSNWYLRAAYERVILDQLQMIVDPDAHEAFRRKMRQQKKDVGSGFWWEPGNAAPARGPRLN